MLYYTSSFLFLLFVKYTDARPTNGSLFDPDKHYLFHNNSEVMRHLKNEYLITEKRILDVMTSVDRMNYSNAYPYESKVVEIGYGTSFSPPQVHAYTLEMLSRQLKKGNKVLDVGCGTGYLTVCFALLVGENGSVIAIDHVPIVVEIAKENIEYNEPYLLESNRVTILEGEGRLGYYDGGPYDAIYVGASYYKVPEHLVKQLNKGGRLMMPTFHKTSSIPKYYRVMVADKLKNGTIVSWVQEAPFLYVKTEPLTDKAKQDKAAISDSFIHRPHYI